MSGWKVYKRACCPDPRCPFFARQWVCKRVAPYACEYRWHSWHEAIRFASLVALREARRMVEP